MSFVTHARELKKKLKRSALHPYLLLLQKPYVLARHYLIENRTKYCVVSFPKSGRTWLRTFLSGYVHYAYGVPYTLDFAFFRRVAPDVPRTVFRHGGNEITNPDTLHSFIAGFHGANILLVVRDPRDVVVSYYYELTRRDPRYQDDKMNGITLSDFIRGEEFGIAVIIDFMNAWQEHFEHFASAHVLRYEDMRMDPDSAFRVPLRDLWRIDPINEDAYKKALEFSSFENMRKLEKKDFFADGRLRAVESTDNTTFKTRKGKVGGHKEEVGAEDRAYMKKEMERLHPLYGYTNAD